MTTNTTRILIPGDVLNTILEEEDNRNDRNDWVLELQRQDDVLRERRRYEKVI